MVSCVCRKKAWRFEAADTVNQASTAHAATEHHISQHQIIVTRQKSRPRIICRLKGIHRRPPVPQLCLKRQALIKRIFNIEYAATQGLMHRQKMARKGNELIQILLAKYLGNSSLSCLQ